MKDLHGLTIGVVGLGDSGLSALRWLARRGARLVAIDSRTAPPHPGGMPNLGDWVARAKTPEAIMAMPAPLWRALALASVLMNVDADLLQPPAFDAD